MKICFKNSWISGLLLYILWLCESPEHQVSRLLYMHVHIRICIFIALPHVPTQSQNKFCFSWSFFSVDWISVCLAARVSNFGIISYAYCKLTCYSLNSWDLSLAKSWPFFL